MTGQNASTSGTEWTREKTFVLIEEYRCRPGLWDMTHNDYRRKDVKKDLLEEVSKKFNFAIPVAEIEKKFHTLRTQYQREINRMLDTRGKEQYQSKWFAFKPLQFLSSPKACRGARVGGVSKTKIQSFDIQKHSEQTMFEESSSNVGEQIETQEYIITHPLIRNSSTDPPQQTTRAQTDQHDFYEENEEELIKPGSSREIKEIKTDITFHNITSSNASNNSNANNNNRNRSVQTRETMYDDLILETEMQPPPQKKAFIETQTTNLISTTDNIRDECSIYGEYIANELRFITSRDILITVKHKINTALYDGTIEQLKRGTK